MSIFGKRTNGEHSGWDDAREGGKGGAHPYGIGDVISLLRTLPIDQNGDLVARVIASTLESLKVHVSDLIQGASKREQELKQRIGVLQGTMLELAKQIDAHREEGARLEADLAETTNVKERLQSTAQTAAGAEPQPPRPVLLPPGSVLPLPLPPPLKAGSRRPPDTTHQGAKD
jgi:hypothetical protein